MLAVVLLLGDLTDVVNVRENVGTIRDALITTVVRLSTLPDIALGAVALVFVVIGILMVFWHPGRKEPDLKAEAAPVQPPAPVMPEPLPAEEPSRSESFLTAYKKPAQANVKLATWVELFQSRTGNGHLTRDDICRMIIDRLADPQYQLEGWVREGMQMPLRKYPPTFWENVWIASNSMTAVEEGSHGDSTHYLDVHLNEQQLAENWPYPSAVSEN